MPDNINTQNIEDQAVEMSESELQAEKAQEEKTPNLESKTFTQKEVEDIVGKRLRREREKAKAAQKTDAERITDLENRLNAAERQNALSNAKCNPTFAKFVMHEVGEMGGDFVENLAKYKAENPQFFTASNTVKFSSSPSLSGMGKSRSSDDIMNDMLRKIRR